MLPFLPPYRERRGGRGIQFVQLRTVVRIFIDNQRVMKNIDVQNAYNERTTAYKNPSQEGQNDVFEWSTGGGAALPVVQEVQDIQYKEIPQTKQDNYHNKINPFWNDVAWFFGQIFYFAFKIVFWIVVESVKLVIEIVIGGLSGLLKGVSNIDINVGTKSVDKTCQDKKSTNVYVQNNIIINEK